jgi:hypothetical protein
MGGNLPLAKQQPSDGSYQRNKSEAAPDGDMPGLVLSPFTFLGRVARLPIHGGRLTRGPDVRNGWKADVRLLEVRE